MFNPPYEPSTWLPYLEVALELVKAVAWPIAVFFVFKLYAEEIRGLFPRLRRVGVGNAELSFGDQLSVRGPEAKPQLQNPNIQEFTDPVARMFKERIDGDLASVPSEEHEKVLVQALTVSHLERAFSLAYANIFGSQIQALNILTGRSLSKKDGEAMLKNLQKQPVSFPDWNIDQFMQYLITWKFVEEIDGVYSITETGRNFLKYLVNSGLSQERPN